jgi:hypothetical protein
METSQAMRAEDGKGAIETVPRITYQSRCPACGGLRRISEFAREIEPITDSDLVGQVFSGRSRIRKVDRVSYAEDTLEVAAIRRLWLQRIRRALSALEGVSLGVVFRFSGLARYRVACMPAAGSESGPAVTIRYGGI